MRDDETSMEDRTSETHPLEIRVVDVPTGGGRIGMTLFPGRRDRLSTFAPRKHDLDVDLEVVRAWRPKIVFSLVQEFEFGLLGVPDFAARLRAFAAAERIEWIHLPIRDGGVPDSDFEQAWARAGKQRAPHYVRAAESSYIVAPVSANGNDRRASAR